ncbi:exopolysaccharide Pel transporter PelG [Paenibacillus sp. HWE-109]|uniref:exopolysaccharide Pel transporter PelG n=1 Tax=Paenibacillus sp. HWE-109 TaxID=1306526 RepID=UPI001EDCC305|nr:exopolysaccharide Pel transporter PelG [Paenibacillus sp. HWE-109]UKS25799.1 exopolysaccharide Pel transporter PelG [Paenibacillus sp. HWE-109]
MAGIGFELRKLFRKKSLFTNIRAYAYSSLVTIGPMLLCMVMVAVMQKLQSYVEMPFAQKELFLAGSQYAFVFSLLITSGFVMLLSRYVADRLYEKKYDDLLPSLYGVMAICLLVGGIVGFIFLFRSPLSLAFKITGYLLFMELIVIWLLTVYVSALKDYIRIVKSFLYGAIITILSGVIFLIFLGIKDASATIAAMDIGFLTTLILLMTHIEGYFPQGGTRYFHFLTYITKLPAVFAIGFISTLGIYVHNFIYWGSHMSITVGDTFRFSPSYDVPVFFAFLSVIPTMVIFVVSVETSFYEKFRSYYAVILGSGTIQDITRAKKEMNEVLLQELSFIMQIQLFFSLFAMAVGIKLLPKIGQTAEQIDSFNILVLGDCLYILMYVIVLLLLYFDDRKGAILTSSLFLAANIITTPIIMQTGHHGLGLLISAAIAVGVAIMRLLYILDNIDYYTYCAQPLVVKEKQPIFKKIMNRIRL